MLARETELEEYQPRDAALLPQIPALLLRHAQIRWSNWLAAQWDKTSEVPFTDLAGLWKSMENQELWEPTFPAGYTQSPNTALPLADVEILSAPDGVTLPRNFSMARGQWLRTRLIVRTYFGVDHNASEGLRELEK